MISVILSLVWIETLTEEYPKAPNNPKDTAIDFSEDFSDASDSAFENVQIEVNEETSSVMDIEKGEENTFTIQLGGSYKPYDVHKFKPVVIYFIGKDEYKISGTVTVRGSE